MAEDQIPPSDYRARATDPPGHDPRTRRHVDPRLWDFEAAYGKASFRGHGATMALIAVGLLLLASIWYLGLRQEAVLKEALTSSAFEHSDIVESARQTNCILALSAEERIAFRNDLRPDAWSRWCWWMSTRTRGATGGGGYP